VIPCFFASDLHGRVDRYEILFERIAEEKPQAVFLGGDLLPPGMARLSKLQTVTDDFINKYLVVKLESIRRKMGDAYPRIFIILGNDDARIEEAAMLDVATRGIWSYIHEQRHILHDFSIYGYACIPPSPYQLKDWERYDVSRHVDPGCIAPTEGWRSVPAARHEIEYGTITKDLARLVADDPMQKAVFLFHCPPYKTALDRADLDGRMIDYVPLDVNIGSIAIERFIKSKQPAVTLHGHVHESTRLTGSWREKIGRTWCFQAAHDGPELSLVRLDLENPETAERELLL